MTLLVQASPDIRRQDPEASDPAADGKVSLNLLQYPVSDAKDWARYDRLSVVERAALFLRTRRFRSRAQRDPTLRPIDGRLVEPLQPNDLALVCTVRNSIQHLPAFLAHYRRLGITRFLFVDDGSNDGTRELLGQQLDVDVFVSELRYGDAEWGRMWRDGLIELHGRRRWYVSVDADEFLVYPGFERRKLWAFIEDLERVGLQRSMAPMLDIYRPGSIGQPRPNRDGGEDPFDGMAHLDGDGYGATNEKFCLSIRGGPRARLFGGDHRLTKFPLVYADERSGESGASVHGPLPLRRNFAAPTAVLLHQKFHTDSIAEWRKLVEDGQHFGDSMYYRQMLASAKLSSTLELTYPGSIRYHSSDDLVRRGFMRDLRVHEQEVFLPVDLVF